MATSQLPRPAVINLDEELEYWSNRLASCDFYRPDLRPDVYRRMLKLAYDAYLRNPRASLEEVLPALRTRYETTTPGLAVHTAEAEAVFRAVWRRLTGEPGPAGDDGSRPCAAAPRMPARPRSGYSARL